MGEIMRWHLTRPAQRRVPGLKSTFTLGDPHESNTTIQEVQKGHQAANVAVSAALASYSSILSDPAVLQRYLRTGNAGVGAATANLSSGVINQFVALLKLDQWLAANAPVSPAIPSYTTPTVAALNQQIKNLLELPLSDSWQTLGHLLSDLYYLCLIFSAWGVDFSLTEILGLLTRWLLVMALVDDLQQNPGLVQTPDDIYNALRWRTLILPDVVSLVLLFIRSQKKAVLVRKPGFADLYITREEWDHYEPSEIAAIENVLKSELKSRVHLLVNQTQITTTTDQSTTQLKEQDTTTTDVTQLQQQSSSDISIAAHFDGQVDTSGLYGATQVNTHLGGSLDYSNASSTSKATTQSHETVSRAVSKIEQTTRQIRVVSTLTRETDREEHKFDNTQGAGPVVGIYRWVDQIQNVELDRYPHRFLMEFEIPEPGAWTRWLLNNNAGRYMINQPPVPLTLNGNPPDPGNALKATDINATNYAAIAARYMAAGTSPAPGPLSIAVNLGSENSASTAAPRISAGNQSDTSASVPNGYQVLGGVDQNGNSINGWTASLMYATGRYKADEGLGSDCHIDVAVGGGSPVRSAPSGITHMPGTAIQSPGDIFRDQISGTVGPISQGSVPVAIQVIDCTGFQINVEIQCVPLQQTIEQWQNDTYALIVGAYNAILQAYNDEKAGLAVQQTNPVDAYSPDQNALTIKQELKRQVIEMLGITTAPPNPPAPPPPPNFFGLNSISWGNNGTGNAAPYSLLDKAAAFAPTIQFLEQAFEWETLSYICYPYYWADSSRWQDLAVIQGNDQDFADFLRAGSARVVLAARPGFEDQVNFFVQYGILWGGGPMPAPGDPDYLSIADEIKAMQQRPTDVTVIDTWQVRLPTTLIWLVNEISEGQLPKNPNPTIDTTPKIVALSPTAGAVGDLVTITGRNLGDIEGGSTVSFNGTDATPTNWSATSIDVTVPAGAATGNVIVMVNGIAGDGVTVNSVASNGVNFTVN